MRQTFVLANVSAFILSWNITIGYALRTKCLLTDYSIEECSFDCRCEKGNLNCETCDGFGYGYEATVESECANRKFFTRPDRASCVCSTCPRPTSKQIGSEYDCFVDDCENQEFTFTTDVSHRNIAGSYLYFILLFLSFI